MSKISFKMLVVCSSPYLRDYNALYPLVIQVLTEQLRSEYLIDPEQTIEFLLYFMDDTKYVADLDFRSIEMERGKLNRSLKIIGRNRSLRFTNFPPEEPDPEAPYDIIWFCGCNVLNFVYHALAQIDQFIRPDSIVFFTERGKVREIYREALPDFFDGPFVPPVVLRRLPTSKDLDNLVEQFEQKFILVYPGLYLRI